MIKVTVSGVTTMMLKKKSAIHKRTDLYLEIMLILFKLCHIISF